MIVERNLILLSKKALIMKYRSLKANVSNIGNLLIEYKAHIKILQSRLMLMQQKISFLEDKKDKTGHRRSKPNYTYLGTPMNRSISAMKKAHKKRYSKSSK